MTSPSPLSRFPAVLTLLALIGCAGAPPVQPPPVVEQAPAAPVVKIVPRVYGSEAVQRELSGLIREPFSETQAMEVIYATTRKAVGDPSECGDSSFGVDLGSEVSYGTCRINVPKIHAVGGFEVSADPRADPHRYFRVLGHAPLDQAGLFDRLRERPGSDILVFVHGFNVKFQEAVMRSAQIAYDLKFQGPVVLFSWPAGAAEGMLESKMINLTYQTNRGNAARSVPKAAALWMGLAGLDARIHLMVHSMGHQLVLPSLAQASQSIGRRFIGELILNAPDIPVKDFQRLAPRFKELADRVTVYCSYNDNAIAASETYNKGRRMGGCEREPGVDVINVGGIDAPALGVGGLGHGYYSSRPILTDIFQVLLGTPAEKRLFIRKSEPNTPEDYYLRP